LRQSTDRILVSHAGNLPQPGYINELVDSGKRLDAATGAAYRERLPRAVQEIVDVQIELGVDIVNDGEYAKAGSYGGYMQQRVTGYATLPADASRPPKRGGTAERDRRDFPGF
jgi:5-methyltetrahydropteroyltriglutamate--homocysteine methyltransferase